ncbi:hypothetical protein M406DRAFT_320837 [Cryphonectria parasitica EP155]|uniref:Secreted protein n=1 Tax=Cryphonectria parasitica (strain ATCC 38755 / EP155) TaxID=660469 RepID=A0A9P4Y875_CRYP1|nr:uncharacterized protein M406DRAFT_320837 [Cryphonectria parasitica EP155]KAF3768281.1 hypothetical protein M406DRAFT_320837 [Cryphonectria parasitica EP155]
MPRSSADCSLARGSLLGFLSLLRTAQCDAVPAVSTCSVGRRRHSDGRWQSRQQCRWQCC